MIQGSGDLSRYRIIENCDVITQEGIEKNDHHKPIAK